MEQHQGCYRKLPRKQTSRRLQKKVRDMIASLKLAGVNMSLKIHFLDDHLDDFPPNCGDYSDEHGERFHQEIKTLETRYTSKNICHLLGEYCWFICRENEPEIRRKTSKRKNWKQKFLS